MPADAYAALPCLRCDLVDEEMVKLRTLLRDLRGSFPEGDFCRRADGCPPDQKVETHPAGCLSRRVSAEAGD